MKSTKTDGILNYGQMVHEKRRAIKMTEEKLAELTDRSDKEIRNIESGASIAGMTMQLTSTTAQHSTGQISEA